MSLYLSASSIADYISCSKRFSLRRSSSSEAVDTQDLAVGTIVHSALELHWKDREKALQQVDAECKVRNVDKDGIGKAYKCLEAFYTNKNLLGTFGEDDTVEYKFKEPLAPWDDVFLVGKMDRIVKKHGIVYDWKSGQARKKSITADVQAIIYYQMFLRIFKYPPKLFFFYLGNNQIIQYVPDKFLTDELFNGIIPKIVAQVREDKFYREGYFNGGCYRCPFIQICKK